MKCFACLVIGFFASVPVFAAEEVPIQLRIQNFDRDEDGEVDRVVKRYTQNDILVRKIDEDDVDFDGSFDSHVDVFYDSEGRPTSSFWHNMALNTRGRVYWHDGKQIMLEIDNDADEVFELRMFLDPKTESPISVFEVRKGSAARRVSQEEFEEYRKDFLRKKPIVQDAMKDYSKRQLKMAKGRDAAAAVPGDKEEKPAVAEEGQKPVQK